MTRALWSAGPLRSAWYTRDPLIAVGAWNVQLNQTIARERDVYRRLAGQQEIVFEVVDSPKTTKLLLRSPVSGSTAYGKVFVHGRESRDVTARDARPEDLVRLYEG